MYFQLMNLYYFFNYSVQTTCFFQIYVVENTSLSITVTILLRKILPLITYSVHTFTSLDFQVGQRPGISQKFPYEAEEAPEE